jgi:amidase
MDATAQAELVRRGELTPLELVDAAIARIERINPIINAMIIPLFEAARKAAVSPDSPMDGFAACRSSSKTSARCRRGSRTTQAIGRCATPGFVCRLTRRWKSGFMRPGRSRLARATCRNFGQQTTTQALAFDATHNPWALDRSTSGSSGGSCAAVAAGMVPVAHANDGGG